MPRSDLSLQSDHSLRLTKFAVRVAAEAMFTVAPSGQILDANLAACRLLETSEEDLKTLSLSDIDVNLPSDLWGLHFETLRHNGRLTYETQFRSKTNRVAEVDVSITHFEFDAVEYCCVSVRDVTKRKQAEHLLNLQHRVLAMVASTSGDLKETLETLCRHVQEILPDAIASIMLLDPDDNRLRFAAAPALTPEMLDVFGPLQPGECAGSCGAAAAKKEPVIVEDTRCSSFWRSLTDVIDNFGLLACWSIPILDEHHQALGTFAISHQRVAKPGEFEHQILATASHLASIAIRRKRFEEQLRLAHEELAHINRLSTMGEMASCLAHELNQPLAAITNFAYLLEHNASASQDSGVIAEHAASIREQALRAGSIISSVQAMTRKTPPTRQRLSLKTLVRKSLVMLEPELHHAGVKLREHYDDNLPEIMADAIQVQQIVVNLVRNAIEAMSDTPRSNRQLLIETRTLAHDMVVLRVSDTGPGLAADQRQAVFEPFTTTKSSGMGMGLTICRSIAELHSGRLISEAGDLGGATFALSLPVLADTH